MGTITIRRATAADANTIAEISRQTFLDTFGPYNTIADMDLFMNTTFHRDKLVAEVTDPTYHFLLAMSGTTPAGYVKLEINASREEMRDSGCIEIARLYSTNAFIGKGVGALLMQCSIDTAIAYGKEWIWLGVWEKNDRAIAFYKKWGFEAFAEKGFLLGTDLQNDYLMRKRLTGNVSVPDQSLSSLL